MSDIARRAILAAGRLREENKRAQGYGANAAETWRSERLDGPEEEAAETEVGDASNFRKRRLGNVAAVVSSISSNTTDDPPEDDDQEQDVERIELPDWNAHFAGIPKSPMEEASHKAARRGGFRAPPPAAWREESKAEGQELARSWGSRDKSTRVVASTLTNSGGNCTESTGNGAWGAIDDKAAW
jgi:hypothetical protein